MAISSSPEYPRLLSISARLKVTVGIRPTVPCCFSSELATERDRSLWPASNLRPSPAKRRIRGTHPTPMLATPRHARGGLKRTSSMPSKITGSSATTEPSASVKCAWTELKREMGSLKADNRMVPHRTDGAKRGKRMIAHSRRARPLLPIIPLETSQGSNGSVNTTSMANVLSKTFASPALIRRDIPREAAAPKTNLSGKVDS